MTPAALPHRNSVQSLSRRGFVLGGASVGLLAACGVGSNDTLAARPQLVSLFSSDHVIAAGVPQRIPFAVVDIGDLDLDDTAEVGVTIFSEGEVVDTITVAGRLVDHDHQAGAGDAEHEHADLLRYYALRTELPMPGIFDLEVDFGQGAIGTLPVQAFDANDVPVPLVGDRFPSITTPTLSAPEGIAPLCTRAPEACSFHDEDVADVVASGRPLALLVATPALCRTAYCGPVLETMIAESPDFENVTFLHLEVYGNADEVSGNYDDPSLELAEPVVGLGLGFEPSLFLVDRAGTVADRIDNIFDRAELRLALESLANGT